MAILVRRAGFQSKVVGACYVYGLEYGNAVFGDLPSDWQKFSSTDGKWEYHDHITGEITHQDPRLDQYREIDKSRPLEKDGTGGQYAFLSAERLRKCGVRIVDFDLI
jgi:hypothetical protein